MQFRQVNPILSAMIANMAQMGANKPNMGAGMPPPQAPNPFAGVSQAPMQQPQPQGLLSGGNPAQIMQMMQMMKGMGGPANTGPISPGGGFGGDLPGVMNKFAGAIPTPDFGKFELPPSYKFFMDGGGLPGGKY